MVKIKVLIADDHSILRDGIQALLGRIKNLKVVGEASTGQEAVDKFFELNPDVLVMDISMPVKTGMDASFEILESNPDAKIIILSMYDDEEYIDRCLELGVKGYVVKSESGKELEQAIEAVLEGKNYYSHRVQEVIFRKHTLQINKKKRELPAVNLTRREVEIIQLISEGMTSPQMADKLFISPRTVETHRSNLLKKLNVKNAIELMKKAQQLQLL